MSAQAVFSRQVDSYLPTSHATGPWGADRLHGGPPLGLLAREIEQFMLDKGLVLARLTVDLFRAVPVAPLHVRTQVLQQGRRLSIVQAAICVEDTEFVRAHAVLLQPSDVADAASELPRVAGPDGIATESLLRGMRMGQAPPGYHTMIETRWVPRQQDQPLAVWFRLPIPLVEGETASSLQQLVAVSDFTNAIGSIASSERSQSAMPYINTDTTLYLWRQPVGEWFGLQEQTTQNHRGVSVAEITLHDTHGPLGRALQARLAYPTTGRKA